MTNDTVAPDRPRRSRRWKIGRRVGEVVLIALGVFLGLAGEQWRDRAERRERAQEALRRIRAEIALNEAAVAKVRDYHVTTHERLRPFLALPPAEREKTAFRLDGIMPAQFEQTAWQLALNTQALADVESDLSFALARLYGVQARYIGLTEGITAAMYLRPPTDNAVAFLQSLSIYYGDVVLIEKALADLYQEIGPQIDRALD